MLISEGFERKHNKLFNAHECRSRDLTDTHNPSLLYQSTPNVVRISQLPLGEAGALDTSADHRATEEKAPCTLTTTPEVSMVPYPNA